MPSAKTRSIRVIRPGWCTTIQDVGRHGYQQYGVSPSGAMDRVAFVIANRLVNNPDSSAALEMTLVGPELVFEDATVIAITGADLSPAIDGDAVPMWTTLAIEAGGRLTFGRRRSGARAYLAAAGGFKVASVWGSQSTHVVSGIGGLHGRALMADDRLTAGVETDRQHPRIGMMWPSGKRPLFQELPVLRIIPVPQANADTISILTSAPYQVSGLSNRMGYRLEGRRLPDTSIPPYVSEGTVMGALQVPPDGEPILLMADRPTIGGYPQAAVVISADFSAAAQLKPGDTVTFGTTTLAQAERAFVEQWRAINEALPQQKS